MSLKDKELTSRWSNIITNLPTNQIVMDQANQDLVLQRYPYTRGLLLIKSLVGPVAGIVFQGDTVTTLYQGNNREIATNFYYSSYRDGASIRYRAMSGSSVQLWSLETDASGNLVINTTNTGKIQRVNIASPIVLSGTSLPTSPYQNTDGGVEILYMQFALSPTTTVNAQVVVSVSPDGTNYFNVGNFIIPSGLGSTTITFTVYLPNNWYVSWTLTNATLQQITKVFL